MSYYYEGFSFLYSPERRLTLLESKRTISNKEIPTMKLTKELLKRQSKFWSYVDIKTKDECWEWLKCCMSSGYGQFSIGTKDIGSHRFALLLTKKTLDDNLVVIHTC